MNLKHFKNLLLSNNVHIDIKNYNLHLSSRNGRYSPFIKNKSLFSVGELKEFGIFYIL